MKLRIFARPASFLMAVWSLAGACGGGAPAPRRGGEFTRGDAAYFDNSVDFIAETEGLIGQWQADWVDEVHERVNRADRVDQIEVRTMHTGVDLNRNTTLRLAVEVRRALLDDDGTEEWTLESQEGSAGFRAIQGNEERLLGQPFIAYLKFETASDGDAIIHWHLSPASPEVIEEVQRALADRGVGPAVGRRTVVVHD